MLVSIILPVYNCKEKISRCLDSFLALCMEDVELIIVNDGSIDGTEKICHDYAKKNSRIFLINKSNGGVSAARNEGIKKARGKYISFVDADDQLTEAFGEIIKEIRNEDSDLFMFDYLIKSETKVETKTRELLIPNKNTIATVYQNFLKGNSNAVWNNIYCKDIIYRNNIWFSEKMSMGEDCVFNANYLRYCQNAYYINKIGYIYYCDNIGNASNANKKSYLEDFVKIYEAFIQVKNYEPSNELVFYCGYYLDKVYDIFNANKKGITQREFLSLKESVFYTELMSYKYKSLLRKLKKYVIMIKVEFGIRINRIQRG